MLAILVSLLSCVLSVSIDPMPVDGIKAVAITNVWKAQVGELQWCGQPSDILTLHQVIVTPYPVQAGHDVQVHISGTIAQQIIDGANAHVVGKLGFIQVLKEDINICKQVQCPIIPSADGSETKLTITQKIPSIAPSGEVGLEIQISNGNGQKIGCLKGSVQIKH